MHTKLIPGLQGEGLELPEEFAAFEIAGRSSKDFKLGVCVCFDEDDKEEETTCLPCPIDRFLKSCDGPLGKCLVGGRCEPVDKDGGCPCDSKLSPFVQCKAIPANNPCIDKEQPCECDGDGDCIIIYLPEVTACGDEFLNGCMVNRYIRSRRFPVFLFVTAIFRIPFAVHKNNETMRRSLTFPFPKQMHR